MKEFKFCPICSASLVERTKDRIECGDACGFVHYNNPTPVAAMVVEYEGCIVLAHNRAWQGDFYGLITGFIDHRESPVDCAVREVKEELDLDAATPNLIGVYGFERLNQIIEGWVREAPEQWLWLHKRWKVHDSPEGWAIPEHLQHLVETNE